MKSLLPTIPLLLFSLVFSARGQDLPTDARLNLDSVILDPTALQSAPDYVEPPKPAPELPPVLDPPKIEDIPADVQGKPLEKRWKFIPFGRFRITGDDNIFISNENRKEDLIFTVAPGFALGWGDYASEVRQLGEFERYFEPVSLDGGVDSLSFLFGKYAASAAFFTENSDENSVDHDAFLSGRWQGAKLTLGMRLRFQTLSGADLDVGGRVDRKVSSGAITSSYQFNEKSSLELNLYGTSYDYEDDVDSDEWVAETWLNYQALAKTRVSVGSRVGITDIKQGSRQTFEQLLARIAYLPTTKLALTLDGGVEWRQFDGGVGDEVFSVFNAGVSYAPFDGTLVNLNAFRRNSGAASRINENITATGFSMRGSQRFLQRFYFVLEGGYQNFDYSAVGRGGSSGREDRNTFVKPSISFDVTKDISAQTAYQYQKNDSSRSDTSFKENVVSLQLNLQF